MNATTVKKSVRWACLEVDMDALCKIADSVRAAVGEPPVERRKKGGK